jgi:hypothetical protein
MFMYKSNDTPVKISVWTFFCSWMFMNVHELSRTLEHQKFMNVWVHELFMNSLVHELGFLKSSWTVQELCVHELKSSWTVHELRWCSRTVPGLNFISFIAFIFYRCLKMLEFDQCCQMSIIIIFFVLLLKTLQTKAVFCF